MSAITARGACRRRGRNGKRFLFRHLRHRDIGLANHVRHVVLRERRDQRQGFIGRERA